MERGACRKMFMTIEPYIPKQPFRFEIKGAQVQGGPTTPNTLNENVVDEDQDTKNTTKDSDSPKPHTSS